MPFLTSNHNSVQSKKESLSSKASMKTSSLVNLPTRYGTCKIKLYLDKQTNKEHIALIVGKLKSDSIPLVRLHSECLTGDVFGSLRCDCGSQLNLALKLMSENGSGVLLYLRQEGRGIGLEKKLEAYFIQDQGYDTVEANTILGFPPDLRDYSIGAQMLLDLGINQIRLLTNNPLKIKQLERHEIKVVERIPLITQCTPENHFYLHTKQTKMGHLLG
ncbi:MAG: GTP cyclohydrolase II [Symploca sp. SIO2D2]|nr:GTP cyclohydrolase II [Symploca sp. SIO2D2]